MSTKIPLVKVGGKQNHNLYKRLDVYWIRFYRAGKGRIEESLKTNILTDARIARDKRMAEFLGEKVRFSGKGVLTEERFELFLETKAGKSENTKLSMKNQWDLHLKAWFGPKLIVDITETEWLLYVNEKRKTLPDRKFFNDRKYLMMFLTWCYREGAIGRLPRLEDVDPELTPGQVYSDDEIKGLLGVVNPTLGLQIIGGLTQGMRHKELWSLEWWQVNWEKRTIFLPAEKVKTRKARTFVMSDEFCLGLKERHEAMLQAYGSEIPTWVFPHSNDTSKPEGRFGQKSAWDRARKKLGIKKRFHWLRHTFLTRAFKEAVNPALICTYAGLSLEEANRTYLHLNEEDTAPVASLVRLAV